MTVAVPPFDTDALRDNASYAVLPMDEAGIKRTFEALIADQIAAADHIDLLTAALAREPGAS